VSKHMWANVFISERRTYLLRSSSVFGHEMLNRVGTESSASRAREQETRCILSLIFDPGVEDRCGRLRQRSATLLSALSFATDVGASTQRDVLLSQASQFREPQASLNRCQQEGMISSPNPGVAVHHRKKGFDLGSSEEIDQSSGVPFAWNGQHPLDESGVLRCLQSGIAEERMDRSEPQIAGARAIRTCGFQMIQKRRQEWGGQILKGELGRWAPQPSLCKLEQQTKGVPIGVNRVRAGFALSDQALGFEAVPSSLSLRLAPLPSEASVPSLTR
jgi:hypothetical protein